MPLLSRRDFNKELSAQFPIPATRILFAASGTIPAACVLKDGAAVIEHAVYWSAAEEREAYFLSSVLNSEFAMGRVKHLQARGQWGARHFDKLMFGLPIPKFDVSKRLHQQLAAAGKRAEEVAAAVPLREGMHFIAARREVRKALTVDGVATRIEKLVEELLAPLTGTAIIP